MTDVAGGLLAPGRVVGERYEVLRELDEPGGTRRYEAVARAVAAGPVRSGERVWLHVLGAVTDAAVVRRIERGARALRGSREHQRLVDVLDVVEHEGRCIAVSEPLSAPSLSQILRDRGVLPTAAAIESATQICGALAAALQVGVEARAVGASDVFLQGVALGQGNGVRSDWDRPESRVLLHRLPQNGGAPGAADEELGLVRVVGVLLWAMLAGDWPGTDDGNGNAGGYDVASLRALRELWDAPPLPGEIEVMLAELTRPAPERRPATLGGLTTLLRGISGELVEKARSSPVDATAETAPPTDREPELPGPPTDRESVPRGRTTGHEAPVPTPPTATGPMETVLSPGQARPTADVSGANEEASPDVEVELEGAEPRAPAIGTTMKSHRDSALERTAERPAAPILVREAAPESESARTAAASSSARLARLTAWDDDRGERRIWTIAALLAALVAIALGIVLGAR